MKKNRYENAFIGAADEVARDAAADLAQIVFLRAKETLEKGLTAVVALHNKHATQHVRILPKTSEVFGEGFVVYSVHDSARLRTQGKYGGTKGAPVPLLDLRVRKTDDGCSVIQLKYDGKRGDPSGFDTLAMLHMDSLPFLEALDHDRIAEVVACALGGTPCPDQRSQSRKQQQGNRPPQQNKILSQ